MADEDIGSLAVKIAMNDSSFQQGMQNLKQSMNVIDSSFKESIAGVKDWGSNLDGLKANAQALGDKINVQKQIVQQYQEQLDKSKASLQANAEKMMDLKGKVDNARTAWEQSKTSLGANDEATLKLKKDYDDLNKQYVDSESKIRSNTKTVDGYTVQINNAIGKLKGMETELQDVNEKLNDAEKSQTLFGKASEKLGLNMENLKVAFGSIGLAAGAYLKSAVDSATGAQKSTEQLTNLLENQGVAVKQAGSEIKDFTKIITDMSSFSGGDARAALQALTEKGISAGDALKDASTIANVAAGRNESLADAANMVADAYNGKTKALTALGILTKEEAKQLGNTETATISMADVQDRLNKRFGGAAQTDLQSYSGQMKEMQNQLNASKTQIGTAMLPVLAQLAKSLSEIITPIANFIQQNPKFTVAVLAVTAVLGTLAGGLSVFKTVTTALGTVGTIFSGIGTVAGGAIIPVIAIVAAAAYEIITHWSQISAFFKKLWSDIKADTESIWNGLSTFFTNTWNDVKASVSNIWNSIGDFFTNLWTGIKATTENIWNGIKLFFTTVWNDIVTGVMVIVSPFILGITNIFNSMKDGLTIIFDGVKLYFTGVWNAIKTIFLGAILLIMDLVTGNFTKLKEDASNIFNKLKESFTQIWDGIKLVFTGVVTAISDFLKLEWDGITNTAKTVWNSLSTFFTGLWNGIKTAATTAWNTLKTTIINLCNNIIAGAKDIWNGLLTWFGELPGKLYTIGSDMFTLMKNGINSVIGTIKDAVVNGITTAIDWIKALPGEALQWGKDFINGFKDGITNAMSSLLQTVSNMANSIRSFLHFSRPDEGPLADYETWMPDFMAGLANGIEKSKYLVTNAIRNLSTDMSIGINTPTSEQGSNKTASTSGYVNTGGTNITQNVTINSPTALSPSETARQNKNALRQLALQM